MCLVHRVLPTARGVPGWSPIQVLTPLDGASVIWREPVYHRRLTVDSRSSIHGCHTHTHAVVSVSCYCQFHGCMSRERFMQFWTALNTSPFSVQELLSASALSHGERMQAPRSAAPWTLSSAWQCRCCEQWTRHRPPMQRATDLPCNAPPTSHATRHPPPMQLPRDALCSELTVVEATQKFLV